MKKCAFVKIFLFAFKINKLSPSCFYQTMKKSQINGIYCRIVSRPADCQELAGADLFLQYHARNIAITVSTSHPKHRVLNFCCIYTICTLTIYLDFRLVHMCFTKVWANLFRNTPVFTSRI